MLLQSPVPPHRGLPSIQPLLHLSGYPHHYLSPLGYQVFIEFDTSSPTKARQGSCLLHVSMGPRTSPHMFIGY